MHPITGNRESEKGEFWMVWNPQGRAPTFRHASEDLARAEAFRLATSNPREVFVILQARFFVRQKPPTPPPVEVVHISEFTADDIPF